ncbi:MAG: hypothetical protein R3D55_01320 [Chloroflexota bacterium]
MQVLRSHRQNRGNTAVSGKTPSPVLWNGRTDRFSDWANLEDWPNLSKLI